MFKDDLKAQIENDMSNRRSIDFQSIVNSVVDRWGVHENQDERYANATVLLLEKEAKTLVSSIKRSSADNAEQMDLGLEEQYLQSYYLVDSVAHPIESMTRNMLESKAEEHRMQGMGHMQHAVEIEQYIATKFGAVDSGGEMMFDEAMESTQ